MTTENNTNTSMIEVCLRWHQAMVANNLLVWRALSHWMSAESMIAFVDGQHELASQYATLSDLALQHQLDMQPDRIGEAA